MDPKPIVPWKSKLNWVAVITFAIGVATLAMDKDWTTADADKFLLALIGALNFVLRTWFTTVPTTLTPIKV